MDCFGLYGNNRNMFRLLVVTGCFVTTVKLIENVKTKA
jgi:hypothetical protein